MYGRKLEITELFVKNIHPPVDVKDENAETQRFKLYEKINLFFEKLGKELKLSKKKVVF